MAIQEEPVEEILREDLLDLMDALVLMMMNASVELDRISRCLPSPCPTMACLLLQGVKAPSGQEEGVVES